MDSSKTGSSPTASSSTSSRRRSSGPSFEGLVNQKRGSDPAALARRASLHDQKPRAGFFGRMWYDFTRGPVSPTK
ncbi:hypothetical protein GGS23DRAFT_127095 [Durotheca rogersii]|uniref:uncharacterized protein n=1 Tax=Durotheca rogersii TaxID=419775 RepID=UPI002220511C|nr:uncharacterized protein GGS23DRAFT_127095 [Durotheca rogersii]KAI5861708.1 hypothetical protein GGS23DRAFT_127095 [Durotheca rogersii]